MDAALTSQSQGGVFDFCAYFPTGQRVKNASNRCYTDGLLPKWAFNLLVFDPFCQRSKNACKTSIFLWIFRVKNREKPFLQV